MNPFFFFGLLFSCAVILLGGWLAWQLLRQNGRMLLQLESLETRLDELEFGGAVEPAGLPLGSSAPDFDLPDLAASRHSLARYRGHDLLLIFFNPGCGFCRDLAPKLVDLGQRTYGSEVKTTMERNLVPSADAKGNPHLLIISTGATEQNRQLFNEHRLACLVLVQQQMEVATAYGAGGTPSGYLISPEGKIASELAVGAEALLALASGQRSQTSVLNTAPAVNGNGRENRFRNRSLAGSKIKRDGLKAGTSAPNFRLPRLDGQGELSLDELRGRRVLLVFSSPHCGPCNTLAPEFENFHRDHPDLEVVMISRGEPKENRAKVKEHGLTFPVLLQQNYEISRRYAMFATPIAYLIDEAGAIAHDVAVGTNAIHNLMTGQCATIPN